MRLPRLFLPARLSNTLKVSTLSFITCVTCRHEQIYSKLTLMIEKGEGEELKHPSSIIMCEFSVEISVNGEMNRK